MEGVKTFYKTHKGTLTTIIYIVGTVLTIYILYKVYKFVQEQILIAKQRNSVETYTLADGSKISINLSVKATEIHNATSWFGKWNSDGEKIISTLLSIPPELIPKLADVYTSLFGDNLQDDVQSNLFQSQFDEVKYLFG